MALLAQFFNQFSLLIGKGTSMHFVWLKPQLGRHGIGHAGDIACEHVGLDAAAVEFRYQLFAVGPKLICSIEYCSHNSVQG